MSDAPNSNPATPAEGSARPTPTPTPAPAEGTSSHQPSAEPQIDPELMDLPAPPHHNDPTPPANGEATIDNDNNNNEDISAVHDLEPGTMGIRDSIASAPNPRPAEFPPPDQLQTEGLDLEALGQLADDDMPGSPTARVMRAIAPPAAVMSAPNWAPPPPNASVNLFIGRALLSNGNDNWPLKPNDIVNWIRKHYPAEWDGDEGRCSAHRVRTYLARKGADMYYEKLNQGCINGWRIRANHLWRFADGGFQGRGMKQEEAIANQQKENEALATAARKEAAAAALAAGHPGVKVSMSAPGTNDGSPLAKKPKIKGQSRRRNIKKIDPSQLPGSGYEGDLSMVSDHQPDTSYYSPSHHDPQTQTLYSHIGHGHEAGPSSAPIDSSLNSAQLPNHNDNLNSNGVGLDANVNNGDVLGNGTGNGDLENTLNAQDLEASLTNPDDTPVDISIVQQAMQAAAGQMDELEMGMQLPIEMQMHSNEHDDGVGGYGQHTNQGYGTEGAYGYTQ